MSPARPVLTGWQRWAAVIAVGILAGVITSVIRDLLDLPTWIYIPMLFVVLEVLDRWVGLRPLGLPWGRRQRPPLDGSHERIEREP